MTSEPVINLALLGWDPYFETTLVCASKEKLIPARVANEDKHAYIVLTAKGEMSATVSGRLMHELRRNAALPKVGDWVGVALCEGENKAVIHSVANRRTQLSRKVAGRQVEEQVLAANIDTAFIVFAMDQTFNRRRMERFTVMVHDSGAQPVVVLNKMDLCKGKDALAYLEEARNAAGDVPIIETCARTGLGINKLKQWIPAAKTAVFMGPSGVGKSSLINRLYGDAIQDTVEVRECDRKGRHTTSWRELIQMPWGGLVIDTPGMRELRTWEESDGLRDAFPDIEELGVRCHFRNCTHTVEKQCAVKEAVERGELSVERLNNYIKLHKETREMTQERMKHAYMDRKRQSKVNRRNWEDDKRNREE